MNRRRKPFKIIEAGHLDKGTNYASRPGDALWIEPGVNDWFVVDQEHRSFHGRSADDAAEMARSYNQGAKA